MAPRDWNLELQFRPRDFFIGAFWRRDGNCVDIWVCLLPMVPTHFSCWGERWGMKEAVIP